MAHPLNVLKRVCALSFPVQAKFSGGHFALEMAAECPAIGKG
jgi:hypothetical protein